MKRIDILTYKDLEKLRNLKGKETIFIKIGKELPTKIEAISLKNFEGGIYLDYEEPKKYKKFLIYTDDPKTTITFFKDVRANQIVIQKSSLITFKVIEKQNNYDVTNEKEFLKLLKNKNKSVLHLKNNLVLGSCPRIPENIKIEGNGRTIYRAKENSTLNIPNTNFITVDQIISISKSSDLKKLEKLTTEVVIVTLTTDIKKFSISPISLENFTGTLILLGNNYSLKDGIIWNHKNESNGLFTNIHLYATILIKDLHMKSIIFRGKSLYAGGFIGSRNKGKKYHSETDEIYLINSSIRYCNFYETNYVGNFFGQIEEGVHVINCFASNVRQNQNLIDQTKTIGFSMKKEITIYDSISDESLILSLTKKEKCEKIFPQKWFSMLY